MELFAHDHQVQAIEAQLAQWMAVPDSSALPAQPPEQAIPLILELAWHLRQRNSTRALALLDQIEQLLPNLDSSKARDNIAMRARMALVRAEVCWLRAELVQGQTWLECAVRDFSVCDDQLGLCDAYWVAAWLCHARGESDETETMLGKAAQAAQQGQDSVRYDSCDAVRAQLGSFRDAQVNEQLWGERFQTDLNAYVPAVAAMISDFMAARHCLKADYGSAVMYWMQTVENSRCTGQIRRAIIASTNIGAAFSSLNDYHSALEWMQAGLDLARPTGWPGSIGVSLQQTAETLRMLGRLDEANELLQEARKALQPLSNSRSYAVTLWYLAELALNRHDYASAKRDFCDLLERADILQDVDLQTGGRRGLANTLLHMGEPEAALAWVQQSLQMAQQSQQVQRQIEALQVLAQIYAQHDLPLNEEVQEVSRPLHFLLQALAISKKIDGYQANASLLDAIADAYHDIGDYKTAFTYTRQAASARELTHNLEASSRASALRIKHQTERNKAESAHHKQLAEVEARRAEVLQQTSDTLEKLGTIGQEITAHLDINEVFSALKSHVDGLLDAVCFVILLLYPENECLHSA
ncbi:MAG: GGDEF domain-containing protein, partial [Burkholderiales bacterium]|nr:GGDEF domain-containing protein [Burkholderiales bacterium]